MDDRPFESMNMIPFIDIMLVLLTIVLTTSSFVASGKIPLQLPQASATEADMDRNWTIEIDAQGSVFVEGLPVSLEVLRSRVAPLPKETPFLLRADREVQLQRFIDVADVLKQGGFSKVAVRTQQAGA